MVLLNWPPNCGPITGNPEVIDSQFLVCRQTGRNQVKPGSHRNRALLSQVNLGAHCVMARRKCTFEPYGTLCCRTGLSASSDRCRQRRNIHDTGTSMRLIATEAETGGRYTVLERVTPAGWGPPRHIRSREDEIFYILERNL